MTNRLDDWDPYELEEGDVERRLRAYAGARLSPDAWTSIRMRAAVIEHGRDGLAAGTRHRLDVLAPFRLGILRRAAPVALVAALAVGAGGVAGVAASPGGPLYDARLWVETAMLPSSGDARLAAQVAHINDRIDEAASAVDAGNASAADAALNAYDSQVDQALANAAADRAELLQLRESIARHLAHLETLAKPTSKASVQLQRAIAKSKSALADIDRQLAALGPAPTP
jgi:hypothetical protein